MQLVFDEPLSSLDGGAVLLAAADRLLAPGGQFAEAVFDRHRTRLGRKVRRVTIDLDQTHDEAHGGQQLALFNPLYRCWCFLPLLGLVSFNGDDEQYLFAAMLRSGHAPARQGVLAVLRRALPALRRRFPKAKTRIRLDAGYPSPELLDFLESEKVEYVVASRRTRSSRAGRNIFSRSQSRSPRPPERARSSTKS